MEDTSLDQFADAAAGDDESADEETAASADDAAVEETADISAVDSTAVEPAVVTATWTPGGGDCTACGSTIERRWTDDGSLVCADCTDW